MINLKEVHESIDNENISYSELAGLDGMAESLGIEVTDEMMAVDVLIAIEDATREWPEMYADWVNNFLTVPRFAEYYGLSEEYANLLIKTGRATDNFSKDWPEVTK